MAQIGFFCSNAWRCARISRAPLLPGPLRQADSDKAGALLTPAQINTLKRNAPFCEECEKCKDGACDL